MQYKWTDTTLLFRIYRPLYYTIALTVATSVYTAMVAVTKTAAAAAKKEA
jgi:hypothetical protein